MNDADERAQAALLWYQGLAETSNAAFMPLFFDRHRYLVLMGGGGSGKSIFAGRKIIERAAAEPGHRFLIVRKVERTLENSCYLQLCRQARAHVPAALKEIRKAPKSIRFRNGSEIIFSGLDDVEKLKSIVGLTGMWIEEASELSEADFNQLDIRLRDPSPYYRQIILSFNPISVSHWLKTRFFDRDDPDAVTSRTTYRDNRFLPPQSIQTLENFKETDPYFYTVYALGQWGVVGKTVFSAQALQRELAAVKEPPRGSFSYEYDGLRIRTPRFCPAEDGPLFVYEKPQPGTPYVIGCDTAGEGSDRLCAQVVNNVSGVQAAVLLSRQDEDLFVRQLYCLAKWYNDALVGIEVNFSSYPVRELERLGYRHQYVRETMDDYTHAPRRSYGFRTDSVTRPVMIAELQRVMREHPHCVRDRMTLEEMTSFVRDARLRPAAAPGAHDDCVMALAIAHFIRPQQRATAQKTGQTAAWTADMWEDYRSADRDGRQWLTELWGTPRRES